MAPVYDSRWSEARKRENLLAERIDPGRPWVVPFIMLVIGGAIMMVMTAAEALNLQSEWPVVVHIATYPIVLMIEVAFGVAGLWIACKLWLGGADSLGMAILRLAGIYAAMDVVWVLVSPLLWVGWLIFVTIYVALLMWQFELEVFDAVMLALITFALKVGAGVVIGLLLLTGM